MTTPSHTHPTLAPGEHLHRCKNPECGHVWKHRSLDQLAREADFVDVVVALIQTHNCECCGRSQPFKFQEANDAGVVLGPWNDCP